MFITDSKAKTIEIASLDGKHRQVIIKSNLNHPRGIAVDPIDGLDIVVLLQTLWISNV
jgi:hypothetical protein